MNCLPCFQKDEDEEGTDNQPAHNTRDIQAHSDPSKEAAASSSNAKTFTFRELAMATKNFRQECLLGEGGFGRVFKGKLQSTGQVVAVKQLDRNGMQGNKEFLVEIMMLSLIQHTNLVSLIGYCADGDQRLLVYEYLPMGNLENQLFSDDPNKKPMDWYTRMKIASGAAQGLEYLHDNANPPIIYRDFKPSNILLDENFEPKLSDFGLAKLGAGGGQMHPTSRVMGTYGYSAPEYSSSGELTLKSDIYSFGVVLLELLTGRKVIDTTRPNDEQNLVTWAQPIFREPKRFPDLADPRLKNEFPLTSLNQAVGICAMCLQEEPAVRPLIGDVVAALSFLAMPQPGLTHAAALAGNAAASNAHIPPPAQKMQYENHDQSSQADKESSNHGDRSSEDSSSDDESHRESDSEQQNGGSSHITAGESFGNTESRQASVRDESERNSETQSVDSDEESYSDSGSERENDNFGDAESRELEQSGRSVTVFSLSSGPSESSGQSDPGNLSSSQGSSRKTSPTKRTGSRRRKRVVTFKEPSKSSIRNGSKKANQEESCSQSQPVKTYDRQRSSSSSSESSSSSSESEEEKEYPRHEEKEYPRHEEKEYPRHEYTDSESSAPRTHRREATNSIDATTDHRVFDVRKEGPKLRHIQTR